MPQNRRHPGLIVTSFTGNDVRSSAAGDSSKQKPRGCLDDDEDDGIDMIEHSQFLSVDIFF